MSRSQPGPDLARAERSYSKLASPVRTNVLNTETRKVEIINKGTQVTIYKVLTCFETFFVFLHKDAIYNVLQSEIYDCVITTVVPNQR